MLAARCRILDKYKKFLDLPESGDQKPASFPLHIKLMGKNLTQMFKFLINKGQLVLQQGQYSIFVCSNYRSFLERLGCGKKQQKEKQLLDAILTGDPMAKQQGIMAWITER